MSRQDLRLGFRDAAIALGCLLIKLHRTRYGFLLRIGTLKTEWAKVCYVGHQLLAKFHNQFKTGSIGHLGSAATVAASSFEMKVTDPHDLLGKIDLNIWDELRGISEHSKTTELHTNLTYVQPNFVPRSPTEEMQETSNSQIGQLTPSNHFSNFGSTDFLRGKVQQLGDFVDTDAVCSF